MSDERFIDYGWKFHGNVEPANDDSTALVIIDEQYNCASPDHGLNDALNKVIPGAIDYFRKRNSEVTLPTIKKLLSYFRERGFPVVHVVIGSDYRDYRDFPVTMQRWMLGLEEQVSESEMFWTKNSSFAVLEEVAPLPEETVITKQSFGAFDSTNIDRVLKEMGIRHLVITGTTTNACVDSTARGAIDHGYESMLVDEGTADYDQASHDAALRAFDQNFGIVAQTADDVIEAIERGESPSPKGGQVG